jgi:hypothetical protein
MVNRTDLRALREVIEKARVILATTPLSPRAKDAHILIESAVQQADTMLARPTAAMLASKGHAKIVIKKRIAPQ